MKKIFLVFIISLFLIQSVVISSATTQPIPITMYFNGSFVATEAEPFTKNGVTYVPLRNFTDLFCANDLEWNEDEKSIAIAYGNNSIKFFIDQSKVMVNSNEYVIEGQPHLVNGCTMVPLSFLKDTFGFDVSWDLLTSSVIINSKNIAVKASSAGSYTAADVIWLARIIQVEGNGTSYNCKLGIANVVLNRTKSGIFPGTIHDVIFQFGQFPPAYKEGFSAIIPREENIYVAKKALNGENNISKCLYFNNTPFRSKSNDLFITIDGEYFYN